MPVVAVWKCDRDNRMFDNKKDAEAHDKMLELAANITHLIEKNLPTVDESSSEAIGLLLAKRRDALAAACKGKPELLLAEHDNSEGENSKGSEEKSEDAQNVTAIAAHA